MEKELETILAQVALNLNAKGKKLTSTRQRVLAVLIHSEQPLSAYDIIDYCKHHFGQPIQAMSVYRALEFLESEHLAHKLNTSNKFIACSHVTSAQEHGLAQFLICSKCDKISEQEIDPKIFNDLQANARQQGFTVMQPQLEIECVCDACKQ